MAQPEMRSQSRVRPGRAPSCMELGADIGALILYTPAGLDGEEIEISRDDEPAARTHSRVRPRHLPGETRYAAVYPGLPAGRYTSGATSTPRRPPSRSSGGQVSSCHWPG